jgi:hypothetical protein
MPGLAQEGALWSVDVVRAVSRNLLPGVRHPRETHSAVLLLQFVSLPERLPHFRRTIDNFLTVSSR